MNTEDIIGLAIGGLATVLSGTWIAVYMRRYRAPRAREDWTDVDKRVDTKREGEKKP